LFLFLGELSHISENQKKKKKKSDGTRNYEATDLILSLLREVVRCSEAHLGDSFLNIYFHETLEQPSGEIDPSEFPQLCPGAT
jgi:hypothetical protein